MNAPPKKIQEQLAEQEINICQFPDCDSDDDEDFKKQDAEMKASIPFAAIGSSSVVRVGAARMVRGPLYPWGAAEVENPRHCDFLNLRGMLVQTHLQDLKEVTYDLLYEGYQARCLHSLARPGAQERASRSKLSCHSATEIPLPMLPLAETEKLIREKDEKLRWMQEMLEKMQAQTQQSQGEQSDVLSTHFSPSSKHLELSVQVHMLSLHPVPAPTFAALPMVRATKKGASWLEGRTSCQAPH
ncbi:septin-1-like [Trichosurus vulpecula]|uniref:septin-1-like n=1 Tax=Trichosurus vulpecula TaxID=9337 RepID=UPI00186B1BAA|nr:septin-1-like [Trichosurus vulpecula]